MALTEAKVVNIALARIGQREFIDELDENTPSARVANELFGDARDVVFESFPWPFATKRSDLALITDGERDGWEYAYALPADCISPRSIYSGKRSPAADERIPYALEHDATTSAQILLTDMEDAQLIYTARIETVALWPPSFVDALAWKLASDFALAIAVKPNVAQAMTVGYERALARAGALQFNKQREDPEPDSSFIRGR